MKNSMLCSKESYQTWISTLFLVFVLVAAPVAANPGAGGAGAGAGGEAAAGGGGGGCGAGGEGGAGGNGGAGNANQNTGAAAAQGVGNRANNGANAIRAGEVPPENLVTEATAELSAIEAVAKSEGDQEALDAVAEAREAVRGFSELQAEDANDDDITAVGDSESEEGASTEVAEVLSGNSPGEEEVAEETEEVSPSAEDRLLASAGERDSDLVFDGSVSPVVGGSNETNLASNSLIEPEPEALVVFPSEAGFVPVLAPVRAAARRTPQRGHRSQ